MGRGRTIVGLGLVGVALLLVAGAMLLWREPWKQKGYFPGGRVLTLAGTTYGTHHLEAEEWWRKLLRPVVPQIPPAPAFDASPDPASVPDPMLFWFTKGRSSSLKGGRLTPVLARNPAVAPTVLPWPEVVDDQGDSIGPIPMSRLEEHQSPAQPATLALVAFPRRGKEVCVRFFNRSPRVMVAEFVAPNPDPGPHPEWTPEPFPIRKQAGDLECTLSKLVTGLNRAGAKAGAGTPRRTELALRLTQGGKPTSDWEPVQATLSDATGNRFMPEEGELVRQGDGCLLKVPAALSLREKAWKVRLELARNARARVGPGETWTVRDVPITTASATRSAWSGQAGGVQLRITQVSALRQDPRKLQVRLTVKGKLADRRITLLAHDPLGRALPGYSATSNREPLRGSECEFLLNLPADSSRVLDLTFAVQQSRYVEFLAKPALP